MNLQRWNPWRELEEMSRAMFSRRGEQSTENLTTSMWTPSVDIAETNEEFVITAELPGVDKKDVKVSIRNGLLSIEGERKTEKEQKDKTFHRVERFYGSFSRTFAIPDGVDGGKVVAEYKEGLLNVHLPKSPTVPSASMDVQVR